MGLDHDNAATPLGAHLTFEEVEDLERATGRKFEFVEGAVYAMADGSPEHHALVGELYFQLHAQLMRGPQRGRCRPFVPDAKVRVREAAKKGFRYPDASVFCGPQLHPGTRSLFTNPTALFEVTSESTRAVDEITKLEEYRAIPSLEAYVTIEQERRRVTVHRRGEGGWVEETHASGLVQIPGIPAELDVDALYAALE